MNKFLVTGRLTREPAYMEKDSEKSSYLAFTLAVDNGFGDTEKTLWLNCCASGALADRLHKELYKGVKVLAEGVFYTYDSKYGNDSLALKLKDCDIVTHTKAYLQAHPEVVKQQEERVKEIIEEARKFEGLPKSKSVDKNYKSESEFMEILDGFDKTGLELDEDGFVLAGDCDLPFDI